MATIIGLDCELAHNSGSYATPSWANCDAVKDANLEITVNEVDASRRGSGGWRQNETTLKEASLNVTFVKDKDDTVFIAIETAFQANNSMELAVLDGANAVGTDWLTAKWKATQWNETQDLEGVVNIEAVFRIAPDADLVPTYGSDALPTSRP
jgi:hypothetical protein